MKFRNWVEWIILASAILRSISNLAYTAAAGAVDAATDNDNDNDNGGRKTTGWNPKDDHPCTIERVSMKDFLRQYGKQGGLPPLFPRPLVITRSVVDGSNNKDNDDNINDGDSKKIINNKRNMQFSDLTRSETILGSFPVNFTVTLSSSNSFSEHRRTVPLSTYLEEVSIGPALNADTKSNETWYLFGETYSQEWKSILRHYQLPPCQACSSNSFDDDDSDMVALSFGIGNSGSGVQWHVHGPGFSEAIHGRKHWILYPFDDQPDFHPDQTSLNWMHYNYPAFEKSKDRRPLECTLFPGDMIYL